MLEMATSAVWNAIAAVADDLRADLDEFLFQARQRSVLDRFGRTNAILGFHQKTCGARQRRSGRSSRQCNRRRYGLCALRRRHPWRQTEPIPLASNPEPQKIG